MAWEIYGLIAILIMWLLDIFIRYLINRRHLLNKFYAETDMPILIEFSSIYNNKIRFASTSCINKDIIGFNIIVSILNKETNTIEYETHYVLCDPELKLYRSKFIKIEYPSLNINREKIDGFFVKSVLFSDGTVWKKK